MGYSLLDAANAQIAQGALFRVWVVRRRCQLFFESSLSRVRCFRLSRLVRSLTPDERSCFDNEAREAINFSSVPRTAEYDRSRKNRASREKERDASIQNE